MKLSKTTLAKITNDEAQAEYINSFVFDIKCQLRKTQKRTGLSIQEISVIIAKGMGKTKPSETYLGNLVGFTRFKVKGDLMKFQYDKIIQIMSCIN